MMKRILNSIGIVLVLRSVYWLYLEFELRTMAEMPQVKHQSRIKANKFRPKLWD